MRATSDSADKPDQLQTALEYGAELIKNAFATAGPTGQAAKNALHGVWFKHPLHPALTDIPIGSWTVAAALDVMDMRGDVQYRAGSDFAIALGLVGSLPAVLSGLTDWSDTHGKPQRTGALHGIVNGCAIALYAGSYIARKSRRRTAGRLMSFLGYGLALTGAYLGGELSFAQKIGVNHAPDPEGELPKEYVVAIAESELKEGKLATANLDGTDILIVKTSTGTYAMAEKCSHLSGPLTEGKLHGDSIICPWHQSRFCLKDGHVIDGPATNNQPVLDVKTEGGNVLVKARES